MNKHRPSGDTLRTTPPPVTTVPSVNMPEMQHHTLSNGVKLHIFDRCDAPVVYLTVITEGGSAESRYPAIAALTATMHREGSHKYDGRQISSALDFNGAWMRSDASSHHIRHSLYALSTRLGNVLPIFADIVFNPTFPDNALSVRREALARNIEVSNENVSYLARCASDRMIMGRDHPLAATDTPDMIRAITSHQLSDFNRIRQCAASTSIYICGKITTETIDLVTSVLAAPAPERNPAPLDIKPFAPEAPTAPEIIRRRTAEQSSVALTLPAIPRSHPDYLPLHLTVYALGGYFGSRLMLNIREEKGLTYGISATMPGYTDGAYINISAETDNRHVRQLIDEVRKELVKLANDPCHGNELTRLRQSAISSQSAITDSPLSITDHYITTLMQGIPEGYFDAKQRAIEVLTPDTIAEMASRYMNPDNLRIAIAGNPD